MSKFEEVAKKLLTTNGSHDGLIASQNNGVWVFRGLSEHEGVRHSLGSPGHKGYKLSRGKFQFISTRKSQRERRERRAAGKRYATHTSHTPAPKPERDEG